MTDSNFIIKKGLDVFDGDVSLRGSNKELRFYEGSNYVGFEAPALTADKIWVLPNADGSTGQALKTDGSGNLGWVTAGDATLAGTQTFSGAKTFSAVAKISNGSLSAPALSFSTQTNQGMYRISNGSTGFTSSGQLKLTVDPYGITVGDGNSAGYVNAKGTQDLILRTNDGTNSGSITITDGANSDISITPNGTGQVNLGNFQFDVDQTVGSGQDNYVLTYDHANTQISLEEAGGGGGTALNGLTDVISNITNFTDSILISPDGAAPPHGTLNGATGNVGIGKDALSSITSGTNMVAIGTDAAKSVTTAFKGVAIGFRAMQNATSVAQAVAIGTQAGRSLTSATNAVMIGASAGESLTSGAGNVFVGEAAGYGVTTEAHNIGIGSMALSSSNINGATYNIAIGSFVGYAHTSGDNNIGIGSWSFRYLTSGNDNIALGRSANQGVTTGSRNIAIGTNAYDAADTENDNIAIGYNALGGTVNGGEKNVVIGNYAGEAITSADENILIGYEAGNVLGSGGYNAFIGRSAGLLQTTANNTVAIGHLALSGNSNTNSIQNTVVGRSAMQTSGGHYNVAIGYNTLYSQASGAEYNTAVGHQTAYNLTTGTSNTFIGKGVAHNETTSSHNTAVGKYAMLYARAGTGYNTAVGEFALAGTTNYQTGNYNAAFGADSLKGISSGSKNIGIGYQAGDNITTGSNNVVIGAADVASATGDDQLSISSGDGGVTWITGDSDGNVKGTDFYMTAEWNDQYFTDAVRNGKRFSFGGGMNNNTNTDSGTIGTETILPKACTLEEMHFWIGNVGAETGSGNFTVRIDKNGTELTTGYTFNMSGSGGNHVQKSFTPNVSFNAGETFNLTLHDAATSNYGSQNQIGRVRVTFRFRTNN